MFKKAAPVNATSLPTVLRADQDYPYKTVLEYTDTGDFLDAHYISSAHQSSVRIFDGRTKRFDYVNGLARPHLTWPLWTGGPVPPGSCVVLAFSAGVYKDKGGYLILSTNIQWMSVLGAND